MNLLKSIGLSIAVGASLGFLHAANAGSTQYDVHSKSGQASRIWIFYDCKRHNPTGANAGIADHGTVQLKDVVQNECGNPNEPTREVWYTSAPGFKGVDRVVLPRGSQQTVFNVTVQ